MTQYKNKIKKHNEKTDLKFGLNDNYKPNAFTPNQN